jgi:hypothetical protein
MSRGKERLGRTREKDAESPSSARGAMMELHRGRRDRPTTLTTLRLERLTDFKTVERRASLTDNNNKLSGIRIREMHIQ